MDHEQTSTENGRLNMEALWAGRFLMPEGQNAANYYGQGLVIIAAALPKTKAGFQNTRRGLI